MKDGAWKEKEQQLPLTPGLNLTYQVLTSLPRVRPQRPYTEKLSVPAIALKKKKAWAAWGMAGQGRAGGSRLFAWWC